MELKDDNCPQKNSKENLNESQQSHTSDSPTAINANEKSPTAINDNEKTTTSDESATCLIAPPNISIGHMYVYNFNPALEQNLGPTTPSAINPLKKGACKYQSPAASSGPICRICFDGDGKEDLVSPCRCTGSVGLIHLSCMERWLSTRCSVNDKCEICNYSFSTVRRPKSVIDWLKSDAMRDGHQRSLLGDLTCFLILTPLSGVSSFLCVEGAKRQVIWGNSLEAGCLMALATFLFTIYTVWNLLTFRYHLRSFLKWRSKNHHVKLLRVQRRSASFDDVPPELQSIQIVPHDSVSNSVALNISEDRTTESTSSERPSGEGNGNGDIPCH